MAEQENNRRTREQLTRSFYQRASSADGFQILLSGQDVLSMRVAAREVTLFIKPEPTSEAIETPDSEGTVVVPEAPTVEPEVAGERESRRLRVTGRLASEPRYAPLPRKGLRVSFVVAEHGDDDETTFHRTYATGEYARRIQLKNPLKGDEVTIDGERHVNRIRQADGSVKESPLLYCYGLRVRVSPRRNG